LATLETAWKKTDGPVRYFENNIEVELGDRVELRGWFRKRSATVNYVPGISEYHPEMEHNALYWVGLAFDNGTFSGAIVDPDTGCTRKRLVFLGRGSMNSVEPIPEAPWE
jgi:hypothetical protein